MADHTKIEWTNATWNIVTGCTLVSEGCTNCYAAQLAATRLKHHSSREGLARLNAAGVAKFTGEVRFNEQWLDQPLRWKRPRMIFVCAHGDLFHENVPDEWIDQVFAVMALSPQHTFQVLTKRPERMRLYLEKDPRDAINSHCGTLAHWDDVPECKWPLPNVWLGTSVEDQKTANERIPMLLKTPAAVRWISAEPLLGPVDIRQWVFDWGCNCNWGGDHPLEYCPVCGWRGEAPHGEGDRCPVCNATLSDHFACCECDGIPEDGFGPNSHWLDWVVVGGESGKRARPMHPDWARVVRDQCKTAGVPFLFKQWGEFAPVSDVAGPGEHFTFPDGATVRRIGKKSAGRTLDGAIHDSFPTGERSYGR